MSGQHFQGHAVGVRRHAVLLPLKVEVPSLSFVIADPDAVRHEESQGIGLVSEVQELQLVKDWSPGLNVRLPAKETQKRRTISLHHNITK